MSFSTNQLRLLQRSLAAQYIRTRNVNGRDLSYIEGWHAVAEANRIFGFDGWDRETLDARCVVARERGGTFLAVYVAKVRITVRVTGTAIVREGSGTGEARGGTPGEVHDMAIKTAETDATKRALATFGKPFGLALYLTPKSNQSLGKKISQSETEPRRSTHPPAANDDLDTHPIRSDAQQPKTPRANANETRQDVESDNQNQAIPQAASSAQSIKTMVTVPPNGAGHIDKSLLALGEPKRFRDKAHLLFVASQPCLICGRQPSDPHHLRFTQPRAMGRKVSDEFTIPLCRIHHRAAHHTGHEADWWEELGIDVVEIARSLWQESRDQRLTMPKPLTASLDHIKPDGELL